MSFVKKINDNQSKLLFNKYNEANNLCRRIEGILGELESPDTFNIQKYLDELLLIKQNKCFSTV